MRECIEERTSSQRFLVVYRNSRRVILYLKDLSLWTSRLLCLPCRRRVEFYESPSCVPNIRMSSLWVLHFMTVRQPDPGSLPLFKLKMKFTVIDPVEYNL